MSYIKNPKEARQGLGELVRMTPVVVYDVLAYLVELVQFLLELVTLRIMPVPAEPLHPPRTTAAVPQCPLRFYHTSSAS